jgi:hypothetical protein
MDELEKLKSALSKVKPEDVHCEGEEPALVETSNTLNISGLEYSVDLSTVTLNSNVLNGGYSYGSNPYGNVTISNGGASGSILTSNGAGSMWTNAQPSLHVTGNAEFENDVTIKGVSIAKALEDIQSRLAILVPDPAKLEHFEALKKAYDHYKTLEALCQVPLKEDDK